MIGRGFVLLAVLGCEERPPPAEPDPTPVCDKLLQEGEGDTIDGPFDADGDGAFAAECASVYPPQALDCDDEDPDVHPGRGEIPCNGVDDDCNVATADELDDDGDGVVHCDDCDDADARRYAGNPEVCFDGIDNDCNDEVDDTCGTNWNGDWVLESPISYECAAGSVTIDFDTFSVLYSPPYLTISSAGSGTPGGMDGELQVGDTHVFVQRHIALGTAGSCDELYRLEGDFLDDSTFEGTFRAFYQGSSFDFACLNCSDQVWDVRMTRE